MKYEWHDNEESLLIFLPEPILADWHGVDLEDQRIIATSANWVSVLPVAGNIGLLFGGDEGQVVFVRNGAGVPTLIRWMYADDGDDLVEFALRRESLVKSEPDIHLDNCYREWALFCAIGDPIDYDLLTLRTELPLGRLRVTTDYLEGKVNSAIVHAFHQVANHALS